jgi:hypothetical protein
MGPKLRMGPKSDATRWDPQKVWDAISITTLGRRGGGANRVPAFVLRRSLVFCGHVADGPGGPNDQDRAAALAISALILCTVPAPTLNRAAIL